jgi:tRNA (mo5U34)-methyltransferase
VPPEDRSTDLAAQVSAISWYHSIDLGDGIVTPGNPAGERMPDDALPDVRGKSVLDIGAWDGYWSFKAETAGAARVVAMDHYAWCLDFARRLEYWERCEKDGAVPDHKLDFTDFWRPEEMPGRAGFDLARRALRSSVEPVCADFMTVDPAQLGRFDVVFFLGVLYHVREPLSALERVCGLTGEVAVIETEAISVLGLPNANLLEFHDSGGLRGDYTNWFVPTEAALHALCRAAGFERVVTKVGPPPRSLRLKSAARRLAETAAPSDRRDRDASGPAIVRYRIAVHAFPAR